MTGDSKERPHQHLDVWRDAMDLAAAVYAFSANLPTEERHGLSSRMRRAAVSVPSNIAEGAARRSPAELIRFLAIACGSLSGLGTRLLLAVQLGLAKPDAGLSQLLDHTFARLNALIRSQEARVFSVGEEPAFYESPITNNEQRPSHAR